MIAYVKGRLVAVWERYCIVLTPGGVGFRLGLPRHTFANLPEEGKDVAFYTSMVIREDAMELFGFATFEERQAFEILRAINKIGPRTALAILSVFRPQELQQIVAEENIAALTKIPGIGQKTAQHVFLELRYKLGAVGSSAKAVPAPAASGVYGDIVAALVNLGYSEEECAAVARSVLKAEPDLDVASAIRAALKELAKRRV